MSEEEKKEKRGFEDKFEERLREWKARVEELRELSEKAAADMKRFYRGQLEELEAKQTELRARMDEIRKATGANWKDMISAYDKAIDDFEKALDRIVQRFKKK